MDRRNGWFKFKYRKLISSYSDFIPDTIFSYTWRILATRRFSNVAWLWQNAQKPSLGSIYSRNSSDYRQRIYSSPSFVAISVRSCWLEVYIRERNTAPTGQRNPGPFQSCNLWPPFKKIWHRPYGNDFYFLIYFAYNYRIYFVKQPLSTDWRSVRQFFWISSNFCQFLNSFYSLQTKFISIFNPLFFFNNSIFILLFTSKDFDIKRNSRNANFFQKYTNYWSIPFFKF